MYVSTKPVQSCYNQCKQYMTSFRVVCNQCKIKWLHLKTLYVYIHQAKSLYTLYGSLDAFDRFDGK